jgi:hypothetical protein
LNLTEVAEVVKAGVEVIVAVALQDLPEEAENNIVAAAVMAATEEEGKLLFLLNI